MATYRIWPATNGPATSAEDSSVNLGTEFYATSTCWLTALHFWRGTTSVDGTIQGRVWRVEAGNTGSAVSGTDVTFTLSGTGWHTATLSTPVQLVTNQRYRIGVLFPSGYSSTAQYWTTGAGSAGITNGPLTAPSSGAGGSQSGAQGSFTYNAALAFPSSTFQGGNYWTDITVSDVDPGEQSGTGTAALTLSASGIGVHGGGGTGTASITLSTSRTGLHLGLGAASAPLTLATSSVGAHRGVGSRTATLTLTAGPATAGGTSTMTAASRSGPAMTSPTRTVPTMQGVS